jgi:hypothetical protein
MSWNISNTPELLEKEISRSKKWEDSLYSSPKKSRNPSAKKGKMEAVSPSAEEIFKAIGCTQPIIKKSVPFSLRKKLKPYDILRRSSRASPVKQKIS